MHTNLLYNNFFLIQCLLSFCVFVYRKVAKEIYVVSFKFIVHIGIPMSWEAVAGLANNTVLKLNWDSTIWRFPSAFIYDGKFFDLTSKNVSIYDQKIQQSHTADQPMAIQLVLCYEDHCKI